MVWNHVWACIHRKYMTLPKRVLSRLDYILHLLLPIIARRHGYVSRLFTNQINGLKVTRLFVRDIDYVREIKRIPQLNFNHIQCKSLDFA